DIKLYNIDLLRMQTVEVHVHNEYVLPDISHITPEEWEIMITCTYELHVANNEKKSSIASVEELKTSISKKYLKKIKQYESEIVKKDEILSQLESEVQELKQLFDEKLEAEKVLLVDQIKKKFSIESKALREQLTKEEIKYNERERAFSSTLSSELAKQLEEMKAKHKEDIQSIKKSFEDDMDDIVETKTSKYSIQITQLESLLNQQKEQKEMLVFKLSAAENKFKETTDTLKAQFEISYNSRLEQRLKEQKEIYEQEKITILENQSQVLNERISSLQSKIGTLQESLSEQKNRLEKSLEDQKLLFEKEKVIYVENQSQVLNERISSLQSKLEDLQETLVEQKNRLEKSLEDQKNHLEQLHAAKLDSLTKELQHAQQQDGISKQLASLNETFGKFYNGKNEEKGTAGENLIRELLSDMYPEAILEDVSGKAASGDILFKLHKLKCLIEVKNKATLTKEDIDKFIRDINKSHDEGSINCGIFVSLQTNAFPGRSRISYQRDYICNTPVIYLHFIDKNILQNAVWHLEDKISDTSSDEDKTKKLVRIGRKYQINYLDGMWNVLDKAIKHVTTVLNQLKKAKEKIENESDEFKREYASIASLLSEYKEEIQAIDKEIADENADQDLQPDITVDDSSTPVQTLPKTSTKTSTKLKPRIVLDLSNIDEAKRTTKDLFIRKIRNNESISLNDMASELGIDTSNFEQLGGYKNLMAEAKQEYIEKIITRNVLISIHRYIQAQQQFPPRNYLTKTVKIISERDYNSIKRAIPKNETPIAFIKKYYEAHIESIDINDPLSTEVEVKPDPEAEQQIINDKMSTAIKVAKKIPIKKLPVKRGKKKVKKEPAEIDEPAEEVETIEDPQEDE
ncbi:MAG: hypothetical protein ACP5N7_00485, partial [Candidatus Pacearchaeota archaeon]